METQHLNQYDLAKRWRMSQRTLERWRWMRQGPPYLKVGYKVVYRLCDIEAYEIASLRNTGEGANVGACGV
ncbi:MAG: DNA-binding protein [Pseudomonadota bacterium]